MRSIDFKHTAPSPRALMAIPALPFFSLHDALEYEERLWQARAPSLTVWSSAQALCVPRSYRSLPHFAAAQADMLQRGWPIVLRRTGGGCVPQGPGIINLTWIPDTQLSNCGIEGLYTRFTSALIRSFRLVGIDAKISSPAGAWCPGKFDLSIHQRKFAGISQRRSISTNPKLMVHAAILVSADLECIFREMIYFLGSSGSLERPELEAATTIALERAEPESDLVRMYSDAFLSLEDLLASSETYP